MKAKHKTASQLINNLAELPYSPDNLGAFAGQGQQTAESLRQERDLLRQVIEISPDGIAIANRDGQIIFANAEAERVLGLTRNQIAGRAYNAPEWRITDYQGHPLPDEQLSFQQVMRTKQPVHNIRHAIEWPNKSRVLLSINGAPLLDGTGEVERVIFTIEDVTRQVQAENLLQLKRDLAFALSSISDLHEALHKILETALQIEGIDSGGIYLVDPVTQEFALVCHQGLTEQFVQVTTHYAAHTSQVQLVLTGQPFYMRYADLLSTSDAARRAEGLRALAVIPVQYQEQVIAALNLSSHTSDEIPLGTRDALETIAAQIGGIIVRTRAETTLHQRNRELAMLNQASRVLSVSLNLEEVLKTVVEEVHRLPDILAYSIWLVDPETNDLVCRQVTDPQAEVVRGWRLAPGQGLAGWVVEHKQSLNVPDVLADARHFKGVDQETGLQLRSILGVPLIVKNKVIGVMQAVDERPNRFDATHQTLLESLAATAAIAIQNAQLYEQAIHDAETKLALLHEVNHRVKNNLSAIIGLLYAERRHATLEGRTFQDIINALINRVQGLATVHELLSASEWQPLVLSDLAVQIINAMLQALSPAKRMKVNVSPSPVMVTPAQANNLALIINELATNSMKYALPKRDKAQITVNIAQNENTVMFEFHDNGPGYPAEVLQDNKHDVGLYLIKTLVQNGLQGEVKFHNDRGAVTTISFKV